MRRLMPLALTIAACGRGHEAQPQRTRDDFGADLARLIRSTGLNDVTTQISGPRSFFQIGVIATAEGCRRVRNAANAAMDPVDCVVVSCRERTNDGDSISHLHLVRYDNEWKAGQGDYPRCRK